jgi:hypothetical protein
MLDFWALREKTLDIVQLKLFFKSPKRYPHIYILIPSKRELLCTQMREFLVHRLQVSALGFNVFWQG